MVNYWAYNFTFCTVYTDVDECQLGTHECEYVCENDPGRYHCVCPQGWVVASDGLHCDCKYLINKRSKVYQGRNRKVFLVIIRHPTNRNSCKSQARFYWDFLKFIYFNLKKN